LASTICGRYTLALRSRIRAISVQSTADQSTGVGRSGIGVGVGGLGVAVGGALVAVAVGGGGVSVAVGGTSVGVSVAVGGTLVDVSVAVGVAVAVSVGGTGVSVAVGGTGVNVAVGASATSVAVGRTAVGVGSAAPQPTSASTMRPATVSSIPILLTFIILSSLGACESPTGPSLPDHL
jgi:hypothetical protein